MRYYTVYRNENRKLIRRHEGTPKSKAFFERNSKDAAFIDIIVHGEWESKHLEKVDGRWVGSPFGTPGNWWRNIILDKGNSVCFTVEKIDEEEAKRIILDETEKAMAIARDTIRWCQEKDKTDADGRYWLSAYAGADVYRLIVQDGMIKGSLPGGYHNSKRLYVSDTAWRMAIHKAVEERIGTDYRMLKADGSGTYFYLRFPEEAKYLRHREYDVPSADGTMHHNIEII